MSQKIKTKIDLFEKSEKEFEEEEEIEENDVINIEQKQTVFINNIPPNITDDDLHNFIMKMDRKIKILECRIVKDKAGKSRGFAFVDFKNIVNAKKCVQAINKKAFNDYEISCAISKPPSSGYYFPYF